MTVTINLKIRNYNAYRITIKKEKIFFFYFSESSEYSWTEIG